MQGQSNQIDSIVTVKNTQPGIFWLPDSTQNFVDSSCCRLGDVYNLESLLIPDKSIFLNDSSFIMSGGSSQIRTSVITKEPFGKPLVDEPYMPRDNFYLSLFIVFGFFVTGIISYANRKSFYQLLKSTISSASIYELMRDRSHITGVFFTAPFMLSMMLNGIFISYTMRQTIGFSMPAATDVLIYCAVVVVVQLTKNLLLKGIGNIFEMSEKTEEHILFSQQYFCFSSWIYLPALTLAVSIPVDNVLFFHIFLIVNISLSVIYISIRLFVNFSYKGLTSIALFILYICSTELLPVLLLLKTIYLIKDF
jgi:hypothetical protein